MASKQTWWALKCADSDWLWDVRPTRKRVIDAVTGITLSHRLSPEERAERRSFWQEERKCGRRVVRVKVVEVEP